MGRKPLRATDKRRSGAGTNVTQTVSGKRREHGTSDGVGEPLANLFNDRSKHHNGAGKRATR